MMLSTQSQSEISTTSWEGPRWVKDFSMNSEPRARSLSNFKPHNIFGYEADIHKVRKEESVLTSRNILLVLCVKGVYFLPQVRTKKGLKIVQVIEHRSNDEFSRHC